MRLLYDPFDIERIIILSQRSIYIFFFFFFKQKTAYEMRISDWSSDVCSSDLSAARVRSADPDVPARQPRAEGHVPGRPEPLVVARADDVRPVGRRIAQDRKSRV